MASVSDTRESTSADPQAIAGSSAGASTWQRLKLALRVVEVRFRFVVVLVVAFVVVGRWAVLRNYWDKLTRPTAALDTTANAVSRDTEYFCPMDPGVVSDWSGKCGVCNMALVRRKKGDAVQLPDGVVARMQLSPYRVQLAGVRTAPVGYQPLVREIVTIGSVRDAAAESGEGVQPRLVVAEVFEKDLPFVSTGQRVRLLSDALVGQTLSGHVAGIGTEWLAETGAAIVEARVDDDAGLLRAGMTARLIVQAPVSDVEPFRSLPRSPPPLGDGSVRSVFFCAEHPEALTTAAGKCPIGKNDLEPRTLTDNQRVDWWCPMHPRVTSSAAGAECGECNGMKLAPRVVTYAPPGEVLVVPESAVIDTGAQKVVYVERSPGMFDGVEVALGSRCGDFFPVIRGIEPGQRVATVGSFLIDAETRLNPSLAVGYFGASARAASSSARTDQPIAQPAATTDSSPNEQASAIKKLSPNDQVLATRQKVCPVTGQPLGSMGVPPRVTIGGQTVFLCCKGCEPPLRKDPEKYLSKSKLK
jgi:hypothetical protein